MKKSYIVLLTERLSKLKNINFVLHQYLSESEVYVQYTTHGNIVRQNLEMLEFLEVTHCRTRLKDKIFGVLKEIGT